MAPLPTKARRGDLVALLFRRTEFYQGADGASVRARERVELAEVAGVTRAGEVTKVRRAEGSAPIGLHRLTDLAERRVVSKYAVDVPAVLAAYEQRAWPSGATFPPMPFDSFAEAKEFVRPFTFAERLRQQSA